MRRLLTAFEYYEASTLCLRVVVVTGDTHMVIRELTVASFKLGQHSTQIRFTKERKFPHGPVVLS